MDGDSLFVAPPNPRPPTNLQVSQLTSRSATISWRAPAAQTNNRVTGYKLTLDELMFSIQDVSVSWPSSRRSYTFSGLEEFDNYEVEIKSVSEYNFESSVASVSFRTKEAGGCWQCPLCSCVHLYSVVSCLLWFLSESTSPLYSHSTSSLPRLTVWEQSRALLCVSLVGIFALHPRQRWTGPLCGRCNRDQHRTCVSKNQYIH